LKIALKNWAPLHCAEVSHQEELRRRGVSGPAHWRQGVPLGPHPLSLLAGWGWTDMPLYRCVWVYVGALHLLATSARARSEAHPQMARSW